MRNRSISAFIVLPTLLLWASCTPATRVFYQTRGNDVAMIDLRLRANHSFRMQFKALDDVPPKAYTFKGKWEDRQDKTRLQFRVNRKGIPDINALFDPSLDEKKSVRVIDSKTVEFKKDARRIAIWGLECERLDAPKK